MKKINFLFLPIVVFFAFYSCNKKDEIPKPANYSVSPDNLSGAANNSSNRFSGEVEVLDSTGTYSVKFKVESGDEKAFNEMVDNLKISSLNLLSKSPDIENSVHQAISLADSIPSYTLDSLTSVRLIEISRNIGLYDGYSLTLGNKKNTNLRANDHILASYSYIILEIHSSGYVTLTNLYIYNALAYFYVFYNNQWVAIDYDFLHPNMPNNWTNHTYYSFAKRFVIMPTYIDSRNPTNNIVEWTTWQ